MIVSGAHDLHYLAIFCFAITRDVFVAVSVAKS